MFFLHNRLVFNIQKIKRFSHGSYSIIINFKFEINSLVQVFTSTISLKNEKPMIVCCSLKYQVIMLKL